MITIPPKIHGNAQAYQELVDTGKELEGMGRFFEASRDFEFAMKYARLVSKECARECVMLVYGALVKDAEVQAGENSSYSAYLFSKAADYAKEGGYSDLEEQAARRAHDMLIDPNAVSFLRNKRVDAAIAYFLALNHKLGKKLEEDALRLSGLDKYAERGHRIVQMKRTLPGARE